MDKYVKKHRGVSNAVFSASVIVLLVIAGAGFSLYATRPAVMSTVTITNTSTSTDLMTHTTTEVMTHTEVMNHTSTAMMTAPAIAFTPQPSQMMSAHLRNAYLIISSLGNGQFAVLVHAEGLESTNGTRNIYIVEGAQASGAMSVVSIGPNATSSEFGVASNGVGQFFIILNQDPHTAFENIKIVFLEGMQMSNPVVVATAQLGMMSHG